MLDLVKAHSYGNDFLLTSASCVAEDLRRGWAQLLCDRHTGIGADGLIFYAPIPRGARMKLFNADGSDSELSGNGLRCLAALVVRGGLKSGGRVQPTVGQRVVIETDAGAKATRLTDVEDGRLTFETEMGPPEDLRKIQLLVEGQNLEIVALRVGNPQCVLLTALPDRERFLKLGAALSAHDAFPDGANVELAEVVSTERLQILIWERGVGPTLASGTGACAAAVAAAAYGGAKRELQVEAPGGTQRVVWKDRGLELNGWAEIVWSGRWLGEIPGPKAVAGGGELTPTGSTASKLGSQETNN